MSSMEYKRNSRPKRPMSSVDGMIGAKPGSGALHHKPGKYNHSKTSPQSFVSRNRLDNFRATDGFHPSQQPRIQTPAEKNQLATAVPSEIDDTIDLHLPPSPRKTKRSWRKRLFTKKKILITAGSLVLIAGFLFVRAYLNLRNIFEGGGGAAALQQDVDPSLLRGEGDGRVNILLLGRGGKGHTAPDLTDTLLVASVDPINKKAALLSIPRDLWVQPDGFGGMKINSVYANAKGQATYQGKKGKEAEDAGLTAIDRTVEKFMGIPIHYHVMVDFNGFKKAIDTVGGIDINVDKENTVYEVLWDESTGRNYVLNVQVGQQHFDGTRALFYSRSRYTSPRGDFDRTERQRKVLIALKDKVLSLGTFANPLKLEQLTSDFGSHIRANMTTNEVLRLYDISKTIDGSKVASLGLADPPNVLVRTASVNGQSAVVPQAGTSDFSQIQSYVRNALKDSFIASEDPKIVILNGTSITGLATKKSDELKSYGYNVIQVANAPTRSYAKTILVDLRNGQKKYTLSYLEKRLGVKAVNTLPDSKIQPGEADFVIIIGST